MALEYTETYRGYGSYEQGSAVRQPRHRTLPADRPQKRAENGTSAVSVPLTVLGILAAMCILLILVFAHNRLYAVTSEISASRVRPETLQEERDKLAGQYNGMIDYRMIEAEATERLGMTKPNGSQTVYVNLAGADRGEVLHGESMLGSLSGLMKEGFSNLSVYLSAAGT